MRQKVLLSRSSTRSKKRTKTLSNAHKTRQVRSCALNEHNSLELMFATSFHFCLHSNTRIVLPRQKSHCAKQKALHLQRERERFLRDLYAQLLSLTIENDT